MDKIEREGTLDEERAFISRLFSAALAVITDALKRDSAASGGNRGVPASVERSAAFGRKDKAAIRESQTLAHECKLNGSA
jgi:hypothetical protein